MPYHISPWQGENLPQSCPVMVPLRGDFFCLPFGGNGTVFRGEKHPPHGETCGSPWSLVGVTRAGAVTTLAIELKTQARAGQVTRQLSLVKGSPAVYSNSIVTGFAGPTSFAHHAILAMPENAGAVLVSTSPFKFGMTFPGLFSNPANKEYQALAQGATFTRLDQVPGRFADQPIADCSAFPARFGYADLLELCEDPAAAAAKTPAWIAAVNTQDHWLWFAFKDPALMPGRVFWIENHGRHGAPWNGRNNCLGIEDGRMFFDQGIAESVADNVLSRAGIPTSMVLDGKPKEIRYIQGAVRVPAGFGRVATVEFSPGQAIFITVSGQRLTIQVKHEFLFGAGL
jgi:hypothetical protein